MQCQPDGWADQRTCCGYSYEEVSPAPAPRVYFPPVVTNARRVRDCKGRNMRHTLWVSLLLTSGMLLSGALIAAPDGNELLNVLRSSHFTPLTHVADLPLPVLRAC